MLLSVALLLALGLAGSHAADLAQLRKCRVLLGYTIDVRRLLVFVGATISLFSTPLRYCL